MSTTPHTVWITVSEGLKRFDRPLQRSLSAQCCVAEWQYRQPPDEPSSFEGAIELLHQYLSWLGEAVHLAGHGVSGVLGLLYARQYPQRVRSLTLLGVGVHPAITWQAHYYTQRQLLSCSRQILLYQLAYHGFDSSQRPWVKEFVRLLDVDLDSSLSPHSLIHRGRVASGGVSVPLMVCGSEDDGIVDPNQLRGWQSWLKAGDRLWLCPTGKHFFHYHHPQRVAQAMLSFWQSLRSSPSSIHWVDGSPQTA